MSSSTFSTGAANPFLTASPFAQSAAEARTPSEETYAMIPSGPAVDAAEVESAEFAVEIVVRWSDNVLHTGHLTPARDFTVGEDDCDIVVPSEKLGTRRSHLVRVIGQDVVACVPADATGTLRIGDRVIGLEAARTEGVISNGMVSLARGTRVVFEHAGLTFELAGTQAGRKVAGKMERDAKPVGLFGLSLAVHGAIAAAMLAFMPALSATEEGQLDSDTTRSLIATLAVVQEKEEQAVKSEQADSTAADHQGGSGSQSAGEAGKIGSQSSTATNKHYAVSGGGERMLSRADAIKDAQDFGMAGMLASMQDSKNAPTAIWGDVATGPDAMTANGNMWGAEPGEANGMGGLSLSGIGEGGGSKGWGVGLGEIGTVDHGSGTCTGPNCQGFGAFSGRLPAGYKPKSPGGMRQGKTDVTGRMPPEIIQRVVRQNFGRFRGCYESALRTNPNLEGRVTVAFVIGSDGAVGSASNAGSTLPDSAVVACVVRSFYGLSFPQPDGGVVRVTYPIAFTPN